MSCTKHPFKSNSFYDAEVLEVRDKEYKPYLLHLEDAENLWAYPIEVQSISETYPKEPKFKRGDKVLYKGVVRTIGDVSSSSTTYHLTNGDYCAEWVDESDLEPYTEPEKESRNLSQETVNCDNHFNTILKDSFSKERRLNIATLAMQGILSNPKLIEMGIYLGSDADRIARFALAHADALIAEADKLKEK